MDIKFDDKVVLVTGASIGSGEVTTKMFVESVEKNFLKNN